ncbi:terpenoid cyclases/Protein prenyltransferase, partial [Aspergillus heteromorphus CBS 117.55]
MTTCIYDTAWLAMVTKEEEGQIRWLFPDSFKAILESQSLDGGFGSRTSDVDAIMNTMAALLALSKHGHNPSVAGCPPVANLQERIAQGGAFLQNVLLSWDILSTDHVGFEILIPCLIDLLYNDGVDVRAFPGYENLIRLNQRKLARFRPEMLYMPRQTTLLHSLEAFSGKINFDAVAHHLTGGAMLNSPSSTAAYLINSSKWDAEAEAYLRYVAEKGRGLVPSAFPITLFEISWCLSTLLESGFTVQQLGEKPIQQLSDFVVKNLKENGGVCGFAPGVLPDADDTAKCIFLLNCIGQRTDCDRMIEVFEDKSHFKTYDLEVTDSFSANCNVLKAMLVAEDAARHLPQICKVLRYLCQIWHDGQLNDKWNLRPQYSMMLLTEALVHVLKRWDQGDLNEIPVELMAEQGILSVLSDILDGLLRTQSLEDGGWGGSAEVTGYALLALKRLASLPWSLECGDKVDLAIDLATVYLQTREGEWTTPQENWIEKVSYGSRLLSLTYAVAAL